MLTQVLCMDDIRAADPSVKSLDKLIERFCGIALTRFHLDRIDLRLELAAVGDQKVDLDIVAVLFVIVSRVEEQRIAVADQLLRDRILKDHALIDCHVIMQDRLVQLTVSDLRLGKGVADQQPGIAHIALHISPVLVERQSDIRIGAVEALVGNHRIAQPEESVLIHREGGITLDVGELHALLMLREERRDLIEDGRDPRAILDVCFADIVAVQREDITLFFIRRGKAPIVFQILRHRHRHTADQYILLEEHHRLMVQIVFKRLFLFEAGFDIVECLPSHDAGCTGTCINRRDDFYACIFEDFSDSHLPNTVGSEADIVSGNLTFLVHVRIGFRGKHSDQCFHLVLLRYCQSDTSGA